VTLEIVGAIGTIAPWLISWRACFNVLCLDMSVVCIDVVDIDVETPSAEPFCVWLSAREDDAAPML